MKHDFKKQIGSLRNVSIHTAIKRGVVVSGVVLVGVLLVGISFFALEQRSAVTLQTEIKNDLVTEAPAPEDQFPVGVNPAEKEIVENPSVDSYFDTYIETKGEVKTAHTGFFGKVMGRLALIGWYQNLASLSSRILVIESGERKEQVSEHFGEILSWDKTGREEFLNLIETSAPMIEDGKLYPGTYTVAKKATPSEVASLVTERFTKEVLSRYTEDVASVVPLGDALTIASLLEREAYDFEDMRHISGVIWNRLFSGMRLQIDATLQYAKGSDPDEPWWPKVIPADKYIASVYNTYKTTGLPPAPIANPSLEAILAALNPKETDCMYYFHDRKAGFHCTETYEEHVKLLKQYYGKGK